MLATTARRQSVAVTLVRAIEGRAVAEEPFTDQHEPAATALQGTYRLPPDVSAELSQDLGSFWRERMRQHTGDSYAGLRLSKLPEDLRRALPFLPRGTLQTHTMPASVTIIDTSRL